MKDHYQFDCPCCGKRIDFDLKTQEARPVKVKDAAKLKDFDALVDQQRGESKRLDSMFGDAIDQQKKQKQTLDQMFESAKEKAKEDKDLRPHRPFDLD